MQVFFLSAINLRGEDIIQKFRKIARDIVIYSYKIE